MENTCNNCSYWAPEADVVKEKDNFGECNKLSNGAPANDPEFILPVIESSEYSPDQKGVEFITQATFGCNQFAAS